MPDLHRERETQQPQQQRHHHLQRQLPHPAGRRRGRDRLPAALRRGVDLGRIRRRVPGGLRRRVIRCARVRLLSRVLGRRRLLRRLLRLLRCPFTHRPTYARNTCRRIAATLPKIRTPNTTTTPIDSRLPTPNWSPKNTISAATNTLE